LADQKDRKRVTYFLSPDLIRAVKVAAAESDQDQSDIVEAACREYFARKARAHKRLAAVTV
jgi:hypothetical protein